MEILIILLVIAAGVLAKRGFDALKAPAEKSGTQLPKTAPTTEDLLESIEIKVTAESFPNPNAAKEMREAYERRKALSRNAFEILEPDDPWLKTPGITTPVCPYCETGFKTQPKAKRKCPACKETIFVRSLSSPEKRRLILKESEVNAFEKQRFFLSQTKDLTEVEWQDLLTVRERFKQSNGFFPSYFDLRWYQLNLSREKSAVAGDMRDYINATREMGEILRREKTWKDALIFSFELCFLEVNSGIDFLFDRLNLERQLKEDTRTLSEKEFMAHLDIMDEDNVFVPGGVIGDAMRAVEEVGLTEDEAEKLFLTEIPRRCRFRRFRAKPDLAWQRIRKEIFSDELPTNP